MSVDRTRIRLAVELQQPLEPGLNLINIITGASPRLGQGRAVQFELALFNNGKLLTDLSGILSMKLEIKTVTAGVIDPGGGAALKVSQTISSFNSALTQDEWDNDTPAGATPTYHAVFTLSDADVGSAVIDMPAAVNNEQAYGLVITASGAGGQFSSVSGQVTFVKDCGTGTASGASNLPTYQFSDQDLLAMFLAKANLGANPAGSTMIFPAENDPTKAVMLRVAVPAGGTEATVAWVPITL